MKQKPRQRKHLRQVNEGVLRKEKVPNNQDELTDGHPNQFLIRVGYSFYIKN